MTAKLQKKYQDALQNHVVKHKLALKEGALLSSLEKKLKAKQDALVAAEKAAKDAEIKQTQSDKEKVSVPATPIAVV